MQLNNKMSPIGALCTSMHYDLSRGASNSDSLYEETIMTLIRADVFKGLKDNPLALVHLGSKLEGLSNENLTMGLDGEEVKYFNVRAFPSGRIVGLFGVWPERSSKVYAIVVDEKWPEYFGLFFREMDNIEMAHDEWNNLKNFECFRNEELGRSLVENDWLQLVPQRK